MPRDLKIKISKWRDKVGYADAKMRLMDENISESAAQKLLAGTYRATPFPLMASAIERAMQNEQTK